MSAPKTAAVEYILEFQYIKRCILDGDIRFALDRLDDLAEEICYDFHLNTEDFSGRKGFFETMPRLFPKKGGGK